MRSSTRGSDARLLQRQPHSAGRPSRLHSLSLSLRLPGSYAAGSSPPSSPPCQSRHSQGPASASSPSPEPSLPRLQQWVLAGRPQRLCKSLPPAEPCAAASVLPASRQRLASRSGGKRSHRQPSLYSRPQQSSSRSRGQHRRSCQQMPSRLGRRMQSRQLTPSKRQLLRSRRSRRQVRLQQRMTRQHLPRCTCPVCLWHVCMHQLQGVSART